MIRPSNTPGARALETARRRVLQHVARGPVPVAELPAAWPVTRHHTRLVARDLARHGLVSFARRVADRAPVLVITDIGRQALEDTEDS